MPIDYTIPAKIGAIRPGIIDPITLANLREQVSARREQNALRQAEIERKVTMRSLLQQSFARDEAGNLALTPAADELIRIGGQEGVKALSDMRGLLEPKSPHDRGYSLLASPEGYAFARPALGGTGVEMIPVMKGEKPVLPVSATAPAVQEGITIRRELREKQEKAERLAREKAEQYDLANRTYDEMDSLIERYRSKLKQYGTGLMPEAELDSAYADLLVNYNVKVAQLGALAGPDVQMLEKVITPPRSVKGAYYGEKALLGQLDMAKGRVSRGRERLKRDLLGGRSPGDVGSQSPQPPGKRPPLSGLIKVQ